MRVDRDVDHHEAQKEKDGGKEEGKGEDLRDKKKVGQPEGGKNG
jgi:hypothetical protein